MAWSVLTKSAHAMARKIVIVEDNPADAKTLRVALTRRDPEIETVVLENGAQALEYFANDETPELVLLDLNLPLVSGFEVLEFLKSDPHLKRLPVVILSGSSNQQEIERCYAAGANSYICKPTGINQVFTMASDLVSYWFEQAKLPKRFVATHT
ncbi:MAG TPA: response regulator [Bryobacteraceae bacterium]|nr:response regulator [Bryobacteraceae bacterium]